VLTVLTWKKVKNAIEWVQLGVFLRDLVVAVASLKLVKKLLTYVPHLSEDWATVIAWLVAALVLFGLISWQRRPRTSGQNQTTQNATNVLMTSPTTFDATAFFQRAYISPLQPENENNIRAAAVQNQPNDREGFYVRLIAVGSLAYIYDQAWAYIFKSQLLLLHELNRRLLLPLAGAKTFYDKAAIDFPDRYANYPFDRWLEFVTTHGLAIRHPSEMVEITVRGRDFLKYLVHWGFSVDDKSL